MQDMQKIPVFWVYSDCEELRLLQNTIRRFSNIWRKADSDSMQESTFSYICQLFSFCVFIIAIKIFFQVLIFFV